MCPVNTHINTCMHAHMACTHAHAHTRIVLTYRWVIFFYKTEKNKHVR